MALTQTQTFYFDVLLKHSELKHLALLKGQCLTPLVE